MSTGSMDSGVAKRVDLEVVEDRPRDLSQRSDQSAVVSVADGIMAQILRVASDPSIDLDRMDKLMAMLERQQAAQAERAFVAALAELQGDLPLIAQSGRDKHKDISYSRLDDVLAAARPAMQRHGFSISFDIVNEPSLVIVTGVLSHREGHSRSTTRRYPIDTGPGRNAIQAMGSSETYGRRYVMMSLLNIASDKDDDGQSAAQKSSSPSITQQQADELRDLILSFDRDPARFCKQYKLNRLEDILASDFGKAIEAVKAAGHKPTGARS